MKTIILQNSSGQIFIEIKTDLAAIPGASSTFTRGENFTPMYVTGITDAIKSIGLDIYKVATSITALKTLAISKNVTMTIKDNDTSISDELVVQNADIVLVNVPAQSLASMTSTVAITPFQFTGAGGTTVDGLYSWAVSSGTLPAGLTLSSAGVLSGTPTTAASYTFAVVCTDDFGVTAATPRSYTVVVA